MNLTFNKYWIFVSICIIMNILIFIFMSNKLESYVIGSIAIKQNITNGI